MITPSPPPVFSLALLRAQAVLSARLGPGTVGRLPIKNPEAMVDDIAVEGQNIFTHINSLIIVKTLLYKIPPNLPLPKGGIIPLFGKEG